MNQAWNRRAACKMINAAQKQLYSEVQQVAYQFTQRKSMLGTKNDVICAAGGTAAHYCFDNLRQVSVYAGALLDH